MEWHIMGWESALCWSNPSKKFARIQHLNTFNMDRKIKGRGTCTFPDRIGSLQRFDTWMKIGIKFDFSTKITLTNNFYLPSKSVWVVREPALYFRYLWFISIFPGDANQLWRSWFFCLLTPGAYLASGPPRADGLITSPEDSWEVPIGIRDSLLETMVESMTDSMVVDSSTMGVSMVDMEGMEVGIRGRE